MAGVRGGSEQMRGGWGVAVSRCSHWQLKLQVTSISSWVKGSMGACAAGDLRAGRSGTLSEKHCILMEASPSGREKEAHSSSQERTWGTYGGSRSEWDGEEHLLAGGCGEWPMKPMCWEVPDLGWPWRVAEFCPEPGQQKVLKSVGHGDSKVILCHEWDPPRSVRVDWSRASRLVSGV